MCTKKLRTKRGKEMQCHFIWQAVLTLFIGEKKAAEFGRLHEETHWPADGCGGKHGGRRCDVLKDPHNNEIGRGYAKKHGEALLDKTPSPAGGLTFLIGLLFDVGRKLYKKGTLW